ncbi:hypothetical protein NDU88_002291 [Pleurodeles waltl]|uniref:Uncharacterized protein n=1 Tax=Pleurodeles waltl TaxID=8319 RepID=A0AAV7SED9_PLEWA|nr:hypothetical protein NDU88_002291 [Pleurodeles waltl]
MNPAASGCTRTGLPCPLPSHPRNRGGAEHTGPGAPPAKSNAGGGSHHKIQAGARPLSWHVLQPEAVGAGTASPRPRSELAPQAIAEKECRGHRSGSPPAGLQGGKKIPPNRLGRDQTYASPAVFASMPLPEVGMACRRSYVDTICFGMLRISV